MKEVDNQRCIQYYSDVNIKSNSVSIAAHNPVYKYASRHVTL